MSEKFRRKCQSLIGQLDILNKLLTELKQQIILQELAIELDTQVKAGRHLISGFDWLEEIDLEADTFTLINKSKEKYCAYVIYTEKEYHTIGLGFLYKNELISPHMDAHIEKIIANYNDTELDEITILIDDAINNISNDIDYLNANSDIGIHEHYYGEYNKGFPSRYRYETISDVINDYKKK